MKYASQRITMLLASVAFMFVAGCATVQGMMGSSPSPEAQIAAGANSVTAATVLATTLLKSQRITSTQAESYQVMLVGANSALHRMNDTLIRCRTATGSTSVTSPDPCRPSVVEVISIALTSIATVKKSLDSIDSK